MSLSKQKSKEDNYRRDSFNDRISDNLCEIILKYLSLEDRLRLECVSKQFQMTAFLSQNELFLYVFEDKYSDYAISEALIKKFQNSNQRLFVGVFDSNDSQLISNDLIYLINKYFNNLTHIQFENEELLQTGLENQFIDKFGHQLISVNILCPHFGFSFIKAPNIEELIVSQFLSFDSQLSQIEFNRLKRFKVSNLFTEDLDEFEIFIERNAKSLKHLDISFDDLMNKELSEERVQNLLTIITKSINLVHLTIDYNLRLNWTQIAIKCKQIKSLKLLNKNNESLRLNEEILSILKPFKRLKRLDLEVWVRITSDDKTGEDIEDFQPFKDLKSLEGLTHLSLRIFPSYKRFDETILTDIDINFPKLQSLTFVCPFRASVWTAQLLSKLSSLQTIALKIENHEIIPEIEAQLIQNCKHFKNLSR